MREYDDYDDQSIRLYTPILQRVIILAAVVIAVPVVMWTITTFVRSYVARPRVPALEHLASTNTLSRIPVIAPPPSSATPSAVDQSASQRPETAAPSDAVSPASESNKGTANLASLPDTSPLPGAANSSAASLQAAPAPSPAIAAPPATATSDAATINPAAAPVASLPRSVQGASQGASATPPQMPRSADNAALPSGSSDRGIAWPNPNATSPPDFGGPRLSPPPAPPPPPARSAAAEIIAPDAPLRGPVPLPRHRPNVFAMSTSGTAASGPAASGPVPLPRARPADAPAEAANPVIEPAYPPDTNRF